MPQHREAGHAGRRGPFREFRYPGRWLALWLGMVALVIVGSLLPAGDLPTAPFANVDKLEHLLGYAVLSGYAVMLFARVRSQSLAAVGLMLLGIGLEVAQGAMTATREASSADALANTLGVLAGLLLSTTPLADALVRLERRFTGDL